MTPEVDGLLVCAVCLTAGVALTFAIFWAMAGLERVLAWIDRRFLGGEP